MGVENARPGVFGGVVVLFVGVVVVVFPFVFSGVWLCRFRLILVRMCRVRLYGVVHLVSDGC